MAFAASFESLPVINNMYDLVSIRDALGISNQEIMFIGDAVIDGVKRSGYDVLVSFCESLKAALPSLPDGAKFQVVMKLMHDFNLMDAVEEKHVICLSVEMIDRRLSIALMDSLSEATSVQQAAIAFILKDHFGDDLTLRIFPLGTQSDVRSCYAFAMDAALIMHKGLISHRDLFSEALMLSDFKSAFNSGTWIPGVKKWMMLVQCAEKYKDFDKSELAARGVAMNEMKIFVRGVEGCLACFYRHTQNPALRKTSGTLFLPDGISVEAHATEHTQAISRSDRSGTRDYNLSISHQVAEWLKKAKEFLARKDSAYDEGVDREVNSPDFEKRFREFFRAKAARL